MSERWRRDPATAVRAIGSGLRAFHDARGELPVLVVGRRSDAPHRPAAGGRAATGATDRSARRVPRRHLRAQHAHRRRRACAGHVDLGALGVADRWADLAIATWSTTLNYGPGWEEPLLEAYGVAPDPERTRFYRLLWELGP